MGRRLLQVCLGAMLGLLAALLLLRTGSGSDPAASDPHVLQVPYPAGPLGLTAHTGERVELEDLDHRYTVVFFGYTHCPDVCPVTMANLTRAVEGLGASGRDLGALLVTVDPERDTPERLARYMDAFHPSFLGLTGSREELREVADRWGVYFAVAEEGRTDEGYIVDHSGRAFVVDRSGAIVASFPPYTGADEMATTLGRLLERR